MNISRQWLHAISASAVAWGYTEDVTQNPKTTGISASIPAAAGVKKLAIDYGRTKMGLALADSEGRIAEPHSTLARINRNEDMRRLREFAREHRVKQIIVGLPLRLDGTAGEMAEQATRFAERVRKQLGVPVELVDERLTSWGSRTHPRRRTGAPHHAHRNYDGRKKSTRTSEGKYTVDAVAAMVILREYLAHTSAAREPV